ncbi:MAG: DUF2493 domain-containing protein [Alphaproteobacteria bacterium]|nr:MAG: DUF2493 domain-containing protein [Alphaproteobacteria bacterium]
MSEGLRVLVCGGRYYKDRARVWKLLDGIHRKHGIAVVIEGRCPHGGADLHAQSWAEDRGVENLGFPMVGRAGPARNTRMLKEGRPTHCLSFPGGTGTADMTRKAIAALGEQRVHRV